MIASFFIHVMRGGRLICFFCAATVCICPAASSVWAQSPKPLAHSDKFFFEPLPDFPDPIGVAGAFVGWIGETLVVAGGANFAAADDPDLWTKPKRYGDTIWILKKPGSTESAEGWRWERAGQLSEPLAYGAAVSIPQGLLCIGGENEIGPTRRVFLLQLVPQVSGTTVVESTQPFPPLDTPTTAMGAAMLGNDVFVVGGEQLRDERRLASNQVLRCTLQGDSANMTWETVATYSASHPGKVFPLVTAQHDGRGMRLFLFGGRHEVASLTDPDKKSWLFESDAWSLDPAQLNRPQNERPESPWRRLNDLPVPMSAGTAVPVEILRQQEASGLEMKDYPHPGFPRGVLLYLTITDSWCIAGQSPGGQVTTQAVRDGNDVLLISGEVRPRVRTDKAWRIRPRETGSEFGAVNFSVIVIYLVAMFGVGAWFTMKNHSTEDYFRGGRHIPWWAAGCSIFATMLSSITFMSIPAKGFTDNWALAVANFLVLLIAPVAIYVALPFFHRIDATSAYEYLELRFNRWARWISSASFAAFHVFRIGVVLALAGIALALVSPLTPVQAVLLMGLLSLAYSTMGGIEAVVWTDTIQTFVLLGGALLCFGIAWFGADPGSLAAATDAGKLKMIDWKFSSESFMSTAIWVVVLGSIAQNIASYTSDQAIVQRYMTTRKQSDAARSIWLNGIMVIPTTILFWSMGTAFWMFYRSHPEQIDPLKSNDSVVPLFISTQLPIGIAGLVVTAIFAAAQSTVSTSMNSGATTVVTDFLRRLNVCRTERGYLRSARLATGVLGSLGILAAMLFVNPNIKSLLDEFLAVLGIFMGALAGLFTLGMVTRRASGRGSLCGALVAFLTVASIAFMAKSQSPLSLKCRGWAQSLLGFEVWRMNNYLYGFVGMFLCFAIGYAASLLLPDRDRSLAGLTLWDLESKPMQDRPASRTD
jgi:SSS family transporter